MTKKDDKRQLDSTAILKDAAWPMTWLDFMINEHDTLQTSIGPNQEP